MEYEICYLIGESKEAEIVKIKERIKKIVAGKGGSFSDFEFKDKRKMAYEIENEIRGTFFANRFEIAKKDINQDSEAGTKNAVDSITEKLYLEKDILRFIIVKADSVPSPENKEETKKKSGDEQQDISHKRQAVKGKQEKKESVRQVEKLKDRKPVKKEPPKKTAKKGKMGDIDKKLKEILKI
ncbi:30S ribosomal protein S6 [bacterium]|nr:30S ribosomal protein S6 [bacterium]